MNRIQKCELMVQKFVYDNLSTTLQYQGNPVPFLLEGSPRASNQNIPLPFVEVEWVPGTSDAVGTDLRTTDINGSLTFYIFLPSNLNPILAKGLPSDIDEACMRKRAEYPEGVLTFGRSVMTNSRRVGTSDMVVLEVDTRIVIG